MESATQLSVACRGRDNNLNLMRFLAATLVIFTHAFGLTDNGRFEPFARVFDLSGGDLGVDVFFVLSGFLVTRSWDGKTPAQFAWARCMRIYPGLWASVLVSVLIAGLLFATVPALTFWSSHDTLAYLAHNLTMLPKLGARLDLPHAFRSHEPTFNVSLWTLPLEIEMYILLGVVGALLGLRARYAAALALLGCGIVLVSKLTGSSHDLLEARGRFMYFFFAGSLAYVLRDRITLSGRVALALLGLVLAGVAFSRSFLVRQAALSLALPYLLLWFAYVPAGPIRKWNRLGDYSYGIYIYAAPIQIALVTLGVGTTPATNFAAAMAVALAFAVTSWHLLERRALRIPLPRLLSREPSTGPVPRAADRAHR